MKPPTLETSPVLDSPALAAVRVPPEGEVTPEEAPVGPPNFQGINIGGHTVTAATEWMPDPAKSHVRWLHWYARQQRWTWDDLVRAVGYSSTTWSRIWQDKYRYAKGEAREGQRMPIDEQVRAIARYRRLVEEREGVADTGFLETSVWQRVEWLCRRAFIRQRIGFVFGESQIGKTASALEYQRRNNHGQTAYCEVPPASGVQLLLRTIAARLDVPTDASFDKLLRKVTMALDPSKLLIVDEVQRVFTTYQRGSVMRCLDTLRYLHDQSGCGLVLIGTNVVKDQLARGEFAQYLKQLKRRGRTVMLQLPPHPPREDLDLLAKSFGLEPAEGEAERVLLEVARDDGFGAVKMLLQDAAERAHKKRRAVTWEDFVWAHQLTERMAQG